MVEVRDGYIVIENDRYYLGKYDKIQARREIERVDRTPLSLLYFIYINKADKKIIVLRRATDAGGSSRKLPATECRNGADSILERKTFRRINGTCPPLRQRGGVEGFYQQGPYSSLSGTQGNTG
jgi:hypothetical protein